MKLLKKAFRRLILELPENLRVLKAVQKIRNLKSKREEGISTIIFSKDRPLQLEALINSYFYFIKDAPPPIIIYNAGSGEFEAAYKALFKLLDSKIKATYSDRLGFKETLLKSIETIDTDKMFFLVDDIVFKNPVQLDLVSSLESDAILSLRLAPHLSKNYPQNKSQDLPKFRFEGELCFWSFKEGTLDWGYPLSVDGHVFRTDEVLEMTKVLDFKAPNSFEAKLQKFNRIFKNKTGVCFKDSIILNIPCNKVQNENDNISGEVDPVKLLEIFYVKELNYKSYEGLKNESCHQEVPLEFLEREHPIEVLP